MSNLLNVFPPVAAVFLLVAGGLVFIIGFARHGMNFVKYGFKQTALDSSLEKRFDDLAERIGGIDAKLDREIGSLRAELGGEIGGLRTGLGGEIGGLRAELETIKVNHFGHLKNFLTELTSILLDKGIISNENKARLDNQLRGM